ncbi:ARM repeat-containing protein [Neocallimastix californiae]|uniref:ARM repeat-containing protein n=1 Tax=Neocallimastix californiae TaxID=1754190 RepID=A0A1Y2DDP7_9FUNG|nr:ARM repeat-containing protein [Neocallimastix californiae]|eukprot:ORY57327.1 ARM repeat-containing protein [Neocallimastix californiae]
MISSSSSLSFNQSNEKKEALLKSIYSSSTPIELIPLNNQTAYGYRAIPKLCYELTSTDGEKRVKSLALLASVLHKPEIAAQGFSFNIIEILLLIIKDDSLIEKQLATKCLYILTSTFIGSHSLVTENTFLILKEELNVNDVDTRKNLYNAFNRICQRDIDEKFSEFLEPHIPAQIKVLAEKCIMVLCHYSTAKIRAYEINLIPKLVKLLAHRKREVRAHSAGALMNISIDNDAKKSISKTNAVTYLLKMLKDEHQDSVLYSLKALTSLSEDYPIRYQLGSKLNEKKYSKSIILNLLIFYKYHLLNID